MATITGEVMRIFPEVTIISLIAGSIIFLILLPFLFLIWANITFVGQALAFIFGVWIASTFINR
mgnify:CR=1 FL=1